MNPSRSVGSATLALTTILAFLAGYPRDARANDSLQAQLSLAAGWTDNVLANTTREHDAVFQIRPGVIYTNAAPRALQQLGDSFSADVFALHSTGNAYSNRLYWAGAFLLTPNTQLFTQIDSTIGKLNTLNSLSESSAAAVGVLPPGGAVFFDTSARENLTTNVFKTWRLNESGGFRVFVPLVPANASPVSWAGTLSLGAERLFTRDALGADVRAEYLQYDEVRDTETNVVTTPVQRQVLLSLLARWRHDWSVFWSTELAAGALLAFRVEGGGGVFVEPVGLAAVRYIREFLTGELSYRHNASANPYTGETLAMDDVSLRGFFPFAGRAKLLFSVTATYEHARSIATLTQRPEVTYDVVMADATLTWQPRREVGVFLRYEFFDQFAPTPEQTFYRNRVMLGVSAIYPATAAAAVPRRPGQRVDRSDMTIPEPHSPPPPK